MSQCVIGDMHGAHAVNFYS